jgi:hypothetical protein
LPGLLNFFVGFEYSILILVLDITSSFYNEFKPYPA